MVDSLVSLVIEKLNAIIEDEVPLLVGITDEIKKLSSTFILIRDVLEDAQHRRVMDTEVMMWLEKVKGVAYDVDDVLEWMNEALRSQAPDEGDGSSSSKKTVRSFLLPFIYFNHVVLRTKIWRKIKKVTARLDDIAGVKSQLGLGADNGERERLDSEVRRNKIRERETGPLIDPTSIVGRENDKNKLLDMLLRENSVEVNEVPIVISIVGMGGLSKTTLAQLAFNDKEVAGHFNFRMWVCVSEDFDVGCVMKSIIESATGSYCDLLHLESLQSHLQKVLRAKRFLLVLDDIWSDDREKWDILRLPLQAGALGSRIVTTTRSESVAMAMGRAHVYNLTVLSEDDCWLLFSQRALEHRSAEECSELEDIGREFVKKCGGLPLAAKAIGYAMSTRRSRRQWELILGREIWNSGGVLLGILPCLLLSYDDLPPALKQCFTYCSVFPKDWKIEKDMIVKLWVAQGFIRSEGSEDMEKIGKIYFEDLLRRSLLQDAEMDSNGNITCKMHDLVHDLAQFDAGSDCSTVEIGKQSLLNLNDVHHCFLFVSDEAGDEVTSIPATLNKAHKLRTLLIKSRISRVPNNLFHRFKCLRVLDLSCNNITKLPQSIGQLKHLRYLDLSYTSIDVLPEEVSNCRNLQTLRLNGCYKLRKLPIEMRKMISLRHLEFEIFTIRYLPQGIGRLTDLQTLPEFIVGGGEEGCECGELKHLNHLQGRLQLTGMENVKSGDVARELELYKKNLYALSLQYDYSSGEPLGDEAKRAEDVLQSLQPHPSLKEFNIWCYLGSKLPKWIEDPKFSVLVNVELQYCRKSKQLPGLGKLPSLKFLKIVRMEEVRYVGGEFSGDDINDGSAVAVSFPKLETLIFSNMLKWEEWELRGGDEEVMPSLLELEINDCTKLKALPCNLPPSIQKLTLNISNDGMSSGGPLPVLPNLKHLVISRSPDLTTLPCGWLGQLKALQTLEISRCPRLRSLSLPEELQHLTMLQELKIVLCPVEKLFQEDRHNIAHIPCISIGV